MGEVTMLEAGQILHDRYQLDRKLGQNTGRQTWLARDLKAPLQELVVVKLLAFGDQVQWDNVRLFEREAQVLRQLDHPQIPKYRDYFSIDDRNLCFGLVQTYISGASLKELLSQGHKFSEADLQKIATDVLQVLIYLHELSPAVLHRDIKPSNLIWGKDDRIYVIDFGAVQDKAAIEGATFTVVGTYGYAPIEQFGGRTVPASDLYGLGATLIHLMTGICPAELPQRNMRIGFSDRVSVHPTLVRWVEKLTEPAIENRFATAVQALNALKYGEAIAPISDELVFVNNSGKGMFAQPLAPVPEAIKGWNWGAFFLGGYWCLTNQVWIGLLAWFPGTSLVMPFFLGTKGNEWAWRSRKWRSIQHFKEHQRGWAIASIFVGIPLVVVTWIISFALLFAIFS